MTFALLLTAGSDATSPTWDNMINGQLNLYDAIRKQVDFKQGEK